MMLTAILCVIFTVAGVISAPGMLDLMLDSERAGYSEMFGAGKDLFNDIFCRRFRAFDL